ncbi:MAG: type II secretion system F family protein [Planctomycetaceae bacterium]
MSLSTNELLLYGAAFLAVGAFVLVIGLLASGGKRGQEAESETDATDNETFEVFSTDADRPAGVAKLMLPSEQEGRKALGDRLVQAGLYRRHSVGFYLTTKFLLMGAPLAIGLGAAFMGLAPMSHALLAGALAGVFGTIAPSFWLDMQKNKRQIDLSRSLPDALDIVVICVEAGLTLPAALKRVADELRGAHPMLAGELTIVQREIQMGCSTGQAIRRFADRFDVEELRSLASLILQSEKFGSSVTKALKVYSEALRQKRMFAAEERAQKAMVKILFPTLFLIFPALFIVILGPAAFDIVSMLDQMNQGS